MTKTYKIVNNFRDVHTGEWHSVKDEPIELSDTRLKEIETVEKLVGYKLVEEMEAISSEMDNTNIVARELKDEANKFVVS